MAAAAVLLATSCGSTSDVTIALTDNDGDCAPAFPLVHTLSIEAIATNGACRLAHQCAFAVTITSVADMEAALRFTDVLLELPAADAQTLVINGRPLDDCFPREAEINHPVLCGYANVSSAKDGTLTVELEPDQPGGVCPESLGLCP
jgi:hypothetical protein